MEKPMKRTAYYSEEISQTALALLALLAAGKSLDAESVSSLRSLLAKQNESCGKWVNLTIFSECKNEEENAELPVIIPFAERSKNVSRYSNGYGALSLKNRTSDYEEPASWLRVFSPDTDYTDEDDSLCLAATASPLRIYAE
jgi:hypothetical protein